MPDRREDVSTRARLDEIAANYAATDAEVIRILNGGRWLMRLMVVLFVCGVLSSVYFYGQNRQRADDNRASIRTAQQAIVSGCELLTDIATQAGVSPGQEGASKAAKLNLRLTITVIDEVLRTAPPDVRARIASLYHQLRKAGPAVVLPDCATIPARPPDGSRMMKPHHLSIDVWHLLLLLPILAAYTAGMLHGLDKRYVRRPHDE